MKYSIISLCFVGFLLFLGNLQLGFGEEHGSARNYITWDDLEVDGDQFRRLNMRDGYNRSRVIVVDKNGDADSITVQGAVDMVPVHNTRRVKIFIRPGIYRYFQWNPTILMFPLFPLFRKSGLCKFVGGNPKE